jgi:hypothetical protein
MKRFLVIRESGSGFTEIENVHVIDALSLEEARVRVEPNQHYRDHVVAYDLETLEDNWSFYR